VGRDNVVGTATRYGLDDPGIGSRLGARFSAPIHTGLWVHLPFYTRVPGHSRG